MYLSGHAPERRQRPRGNPAEPDRHDLIATILGSYREMPGLRLRIEQAARLFGLSVHTCAVVLDELVEQGFLLKGLDGQYGVPQ